jgi:hypothetical protein
LPAQDVSATAAAGIFNSLDSEQQQAILDRLGQSSNTSSGTTGNQSNLQRRNSGGTATDLSSSRRRLLTGRDLLPEIPKLKEGDIILIDVTFPQAKTNPATTAADTPAEVATTSPPESEVPLTDQERARLREFMTWCSRILIRWSGRLVDIARICMRWGLTVEQATTRVAAEPAFQLQ